MLGICLPRHLKEAIDSARGEIPRSRYLSIILERIYEKERKGDNYNVERQQTKSRLQLRQGHADPSEVTLADS